ncbi:hypothetical protein AAMO2058_000054600 [Amorphochlora amoebiformis]
MAGLPIKRPLRKKDEVNKDIAVNDVESIGNKKLRMQSFNLAGMSCLELSQFVDRHFPGQGYGDIFLRNEVSGDDAIKLEKDDLRAMGITKMNHILRFFHLRTSGNIIPAEKMKKEYKGFSKSEAKFVRVPLWQVVKETDGKGDKRYFLCWEPMGDLDSEYKAGKMLKCGKSGPLTLYDLHRDLASDGKYNYIIEEIYRHPSQIETQIEKIAAEMEASGVHVIPKTPAYVHLNIEVTEINLVAERFSVACELYLCWEDSEIFKEKRAIAIVEDDEDFRQYIELPIALTRRGEEEMPISFDHLFKHAVGSTLIIRYREETYNPRTKVVHGKYKLSVAIEETMELQRFPFDRQLLHVFLVADLGDWKFLRHPPPNWQLTPERRESRCRVHLSTRVAAEYKVFSPLVNYNPDKGGIEFIARVQRYQNFYFLNVILPAFIITMLGVNAFLFKRDSPRLLEARVTLVIRLLLTIVAFKLWVSSVLPIISYTTVMDLYIMTTYLLMAFVAAEALAVFFLVEEGFLEDAKEVDVVCASIYVALWGGVNLVYCFAVCTGYCYQSWDSVKRLR